MEFFFVGVATATEVAYYAYIYSVVPAARYQRVTGYCRSATLLGSAAGSPSGRPPVTVASVPPRRLVYATLASAAVAFAAPWFPPTAYAADVVARPGAALTLRPLRRIATVGRRDSREVSIDSALVIELSVEGWACSNRPSSQLPDPKRLTVVRERDVEPVGGGSRVAHGLCHLPVLCCCALNTSASSRGRARPLAWKTVKSMPAPAEMRRCDSALVIIEPLTAPSSQLLEQPDTSQSEEK
ncbi:hypothetical protein CRUP_012031 [Coryphaenoides rupestris]|nr:hypothetical protein CRUP_012031 [Coryphaenoides rupestris]